MPLDAQHGWDRGDDGHRRRDPGRPAGRVRARRRSARTTRGSAPAEAWLVDGGPGRVGVIASVTRPFCGDCDRVRLTADGQVRNCLFAREESDLRGRAAGRRRRRGARPTGCGASLLAQAARPRHRRPGASCSRPGRCPPSAADRSRRLRSARRRATRRTAPSGAGTPRVSRKPARCSRWSSHASQVLRRSGACSLGLFQTRTQVAGAWQPLAEQTGEVVSVLTAAAPHAPRGEGRCRAATGGAARHRARCVRTPAGHRPPRGATLGNEYCTNRCHVSPGCRRWRAGPGRGPRRASARSAPGRRWPTPRRRRGAPARQEDQHPAEPAVR